MNRSDPGNEKKTKERAFTEGGGCVRADGYGCSWKPSQQNSVLLQLEHSNAVGVQTVIKYVRIQGANPLHLTLNLNEDETEFLLATTGQRMKSLCD